MASFSSPPVQASLGRPPSCGRPPGPRRWDRLPGQESLDRQLWASVGLDPSSEAVFFNALSLKLWIIIFILVAKFSEKLWIIIEGRRDTSSIVITLN